VIPNQSYQSKQSKQLPTHQERPDVPTSFGKADDDILQLLADVMREHHPDLADAGVRIGIVTAESDSGDAVKHHGSPAFATIKVVSLRDRVTKGTDAELLLDLAKWGQLRHRQRLALLDHELSHLKLKKSWRVNILDPETGEPTGETELKWESDDLNRPKLGTIPGDWDSGDGFARVVARWGSDAIEYENIAQCKSRADQARREGERGGV
jgi:hypothetical protein